MPRAGLVRFFRKVVGSKSGSRLEGEFFRGLRPRKPFELFAMTELAGALVALNEAVGEADLLPKNPLCILEARGDVEVEESVEPQGEKGRGSGSVTAIEVAGDVGLFARSGIEGYIADVARLGDLGLVLILNILRGGNNEEEGAPDERDLERVPAEVLVVDGGSGGEGTRREGDQTILL